MEFGIYLKETGKLFAKYLVFEMYIFNEYLST